MLDLYEKYLYSKAMTAAYEAAEKATCNRAHVGAVLVNNVGIIIGTGYNTSLEGRPTCEDVGCLMQDNSCKRTVHAEVNAIYDALRNGYVIEGNTIVCTHYPCADCLKYMALHKIDCVIYDKPYTPKYELEVDVVLLEYKEIVE